MKILHICTGFDLDYQGGITNYVRSIAYTQANNGNDVYVLADGGKDNKYKILINKTKIFKYSFSHKKDNKQYNYIKNLLNSYNFNIIHIHLMLNVDQRIWRLLEGRDYVVSLHDYYFICPRIQMIRPGASCCRMASYDKCKKCFSILESNHYIYKLFEKIIGKEKTANFKVKNEQIYKKWITNNKLLLEKANYLLPVSNRVKNIFSDSSIRGKYKVMHIGNISAENYEKTLSFSNNKKIKMVILSSVSEIKGGSLFCDIYKKCNNPFLEVHFYGRCNMIESEMINSAGIINHGIYKQSELQTLLKEYDMGIMTPIWEDNGPQVVMEMINNNLPVFATNMGGIPDFVNMDNGFIFDPFDSNEIEKAINFLSNLNREKINEMRKNLVRTETPDEHYFELMKLYDGILAKREKNDK